MAKYIPRLFRTWWQHHGGDIMKANDLAEPVKAIADPQGRGRQYLATFLSRLSGTHTAGFVLIRQEPAGKWTAATYALTEVASTGTKGHRTHRTDRTNDAAATSGVSPMGPIRCRQKRRRTSRWRGGDMTVAQLSSRSQ
jgi:hypothetical protein